MNRALPTEAVAFADAVRAALGRLGGVDMARRAERAPGLRTTEVEPVLGALGLLDLAPLTDDVETIAAAMAVREAGAVVCPWPLVAVIANDVDEADALYVTECAPTRLEHLDLVSTPVAVGADGELLTVVADGRLLGAPLDPFGVPCTAARRDGGHAARGRLALVLTSHWILGALQSVLRLSVTHSRERQQFGRPIGEFGAVRWRLSDMAVACAGLEELSMYTLWRHVAGEVTAADVLALRLYALEAAGAVLTHGHQIFAAIGLCDEHDMSIIDRHLQPALRRPGGLRATGRALARVVPADGFDGLFPIPAAAPSAAFACDG